MSAEFMDIFSWFQDEDTWPEGSLRRRVQAILNNQREDTEATNDNEEFRDEVQTMATIFYVLPDRGSQFVAECRQLYHTLGALFGEDLRAAAFDHLVLGFDGIECVEHYVKLLAILFEADDAEFAMRSNRGLREFEFLNEFPAHKAVLLLNTER